MTDMKSLVKQNTVNIIRIMQSNTCVKDISDFFYFHFTGRGGVVPPSGKSEIHEDAHQAKVAFKKDTC